MIIVSITLLSALLGAICCAFYLINKTLIRFNNKIDMIHDHLHLRIENLRSYVGILDTDLHEFKYICKKQMRPNTHMMDAQNIKDKDD